jgi:uracil-DNA glycosylase
MGRRFLSPGTSVRWPVVPADPPPTFATLEDLARHASACTRCALAKGRTNVVVGEGDPHARLLVVGEGPGRDEDLQGRPFVGRSGQLLDRLLAEEAGLTRAEVYIANVVKCRPPQNRDPLPDEIAACRPYLEQQVRLIDPAVVLTLGNFSTKLLLDTKDGISRLRGRTFPYSGGAVLVPTFHPAAALRGGGEVLAQMRADFVRAKQALRPAQGEPAADHGSVPTGEAAR